jgi:flagellar hook-associated protein 1 FlgK
VGSGRVLVESGNNYALTTAIAPSSDANAGHNNIVWPESTSASVNISSEITSGKMAGWLQTRDTKIAGYMSDLNSLAQTLATEVNALHIGGYGLDGITTGTVFFEVLGPDFASKMAVNQDILDNPNLIAAASAPVLPLTNALPGDASNAAAIADLRTALTMNGDTATFDDAANALVGQVGHDVQEATTYQSHQADMLAYLDNYRESVSGVNLDEEMVNLVKYQAAYNAAAKMITVGDEMLNTLMNMI